MAKYYAVKNGRKPGIYSSWDECKKQVEKFKGAIYKSFTSLEDAKVFIKEEKIEFDGGLIAYVDGSYNIKTHEYGFGYVIIEEQKVIKEMYGKGADENYASMRNVAGEILGSICAMEFIKTMVINKFVFILITRELKNGQMVCGKQTNQEHKNISVK